MYFTSLSKILKAKKKKNKRKKFVDVEDGLNKNIRYDLSEKIDGKTET